MQALLISHVCVSILTFP